MSETRTITPAIKLILAISGFFLLGLGLGLWINKKTVELPPLRTEFRNPDGPPRMKGPTSPPPQPQTR